jgi:large conductance mechanosensitive channel
MDQELRQAVDQSNLPFHMGNPSAIFRPGGPKLLQEFKEFALRGSVMDMAIGIIMGVAFGRIVTSFVEDILMPPLSLLMHRSDATNLFVSLSRNHYTTLAAAKAAGVATINYGVFFNAVFNFMLVAFAIFMLVKNLNRYKRQQDARPTSRECPFCYSVIPIKATRCSHCTATIEPVTA